MVRRGGVVEGMVEWLGVEMCFNEWLNKIL